MLAVVMKICLVWSLRTWLLLTTRPLSRILDHSGCFGGGLLGGRYHTCVCWLSAVVKQGQRARGAGWNWEGTDWFSLSPRYQLRRRGCIPRGLGMYCPVTRLAVGWGLGRCSLLALTVVPSAAVCQEGFIVQLRAAQCGY